MSDGGVAQKEWPLLALSKDLVDGLKSMCDQSIEATLYHYLVRIVLAWA